MTSTTLPAVPLGQRVWSQTWRVAVAALTGLLTAGLVWPTMDTRGWSDLHVGALILGDVGAGLAALVLLPFRHRAPLVITVVIGALSSVSTLAVGAAAIATVSLATRRRAVELAVAGAVLLGATVLYDVVLAPPADDMPLWQILIAGVVGIALLVVIGIAIGQRRALLLSLRERAALLERDQQLREDRAREQERAHIAREMHDVLGHRLSLVALHAGALEYRGPGLTPDETAAAAGVVRAEAHSALTDLRDVLGVLRDPAATGGDEVTGTAPPQPTLVDLPDLLDQARAGGATVRARVDADGAAVPTAVGRHAYRIVQESLTNARRHAPGQPVDVVVETVPGPGVRVVVSNTLTDGPAHADASGKTAGHGLRGLAERARLVGGSFRAGSDDRHVHVVEAVLPWTP
ncbi:sensor histidine kinase [Curtobacterium flaccumfaciens]|uniref:sensor histidine kinase n=1 Tax=Curtobacterium flaccumfaciens TaxID=2035 RepID=UPI000FFE5A40|nr:histidine kinase [Curtobacterium flaccumfaciens]MCS0644429.1 histidine kinase [Curtobacterium flaccumfaciens pv. flaccumfaciens]MCS6525322.1 histidine kinase [Curtobacterium flaccumfaciens pv. flaccumfaciens]MCS6530715.1 histidine kinase [Curtobacterium flaccumfaciens pv. flaccumfaciens]NUU09682.1 two-component sensor histidine kinase [Curtobacterium flaccumfaciens]RXF83872.1 two-component sensor histidine kinase [Curtobacterium flaccumfaciens pv. flaccumfaciens]